MPRSTATESRDRLRTALAAVSRSAGIIVGPGWSDIATPDELDPLLRDQHVIPLTHGVYGTLTGNPTRVRETLLAFMVFDVPRFTDAVMTWDLRFPNS
ncbi:MAG: hypothetical protein M1415_02175 [Firmicutes bacterium]|jgi:hypothetical protein|nr:hypothetical protein [Bacillota bacterium]